MLVLRLKEMHFLTGFSQGQSLASELVRCYTLICNYLIKQIIECQQDKLPSGRCFSGSPQLEPSLLVWQQASDHRQGDIFTSPGHSNYVCRYDLYQILWLLLSLWIWEWSPIQLMCEKLFCLCSWKAFGPEPLYLWLPSQVAGGLSPYQPNWDQWCPLYQPPPPSKQKDWTDQKQEIPLFR